MQIEAIAMVYDPEAASVKRRPMDFQYRETKNGVAVSLPCIGDRRFALHQDLSKASFRLNVSEGMINGLATVVCGTDGEKIKPFWVKPRRNQREADRNVDARFSSPRPFCVLMLGKNCILTILEVSLKRNPNFVEVTQEIIFSGAPKRLGGKFIFTESLLSDHPAFNDAFRAVIKKANSSDGGGPIFILEDDPEKVYRKANPVDLLSGADGRYRFSGGIAMPIGNGTRMTIRQQ